MRLAIPLPIPLGRPSLRASVDAAPGTALMLFVIAAGLAATGLTSLAFGIACVTEPDPGTECSVLIAAVPLVTLPMAFGLAIVGAGFAGWLVRGIDEDDVEPQTATDTHEDGSRTA